MLHEHLIMGTTLTEEEEEKERQQQGQYTQWAQWYRALVCLADSLLGAHAESCCYCLSFAKTLLISDNKRNFVSSSWKILKLLQHGGGVYKEKAYSWSSNHSEFGCSCHYLVLTFAFIIQWNTDFFLFLYKDLPLNLSMDQSSSFSFASEKVKGEENGAWSLSSAVTSIELRLWSLFSHITSWEGNTGMLSLTSSITRMTVPVPVFKAEIQKSYFYSQMRKQ